jgi:hypothetical protein
MEKPLPSVLPVHPSFQRRLESNIVLWDLCFKYTKLKESCRKPGRVGKTLPPFILPTNPVQQVSLAMLCHIERREESVLLVIPCHLGNPLGISSKFKVMMMDSDLRQNDHRGKWVEEVIV